MVGVGGILAEAVADEAQRINFPTALLERFGARRLMWGSNFPMDNRRGIPGLLALAQETLGFVSASDRALMFGGNALALWPFET